MDAGHWHDLLRTVVAGRKVVLTGNPVAGQRALAETLTSELQATDVFVIGEGLGTGPLPECEWVALDVSGATTMEAIRAGQAALRELPGDVVEALERFDPGADALVIGSFLNELPEVAGRAALAWRRPEWVALEDKVVVDELWDAASVVRPPTKIVAVDELEAETDVVWAGDARDGFHGGADLTRWIRTDDDAERARRELRARCDRVRVMPFLEGIPCSIHGIVLPDHVAALRPVEMVTLRRDGELFYAGVATYWDPPDADRELMRDIARRVGAELRRRVGFRGAFTVDGVMTENGFRPTELNPRMGAGLLTIAGAARLPVDLLNQCLVAGLELDYRAADLERFLLEAADERRVGGTWRAIPTVIEKREKQPLRWTGEGWASADAESASATFSAGASNIGSFLRLHLDPARTPVGQSVGARAAAFYAFCDAELGAEIGPVTPAPDVRGA